MPSALSFLEAHRPEHGPAVSRRVVARRAAGKPRAEGATAALGGQGKRAFNNLGKELPAAASHELGVAPATKEAQAIADELYATFVSQGSLTGDVNNLGKPSAAASYELGAAPTTKEAQAIADELYANFVSQEVDKVEMIYTKFVSLISSDPTVQTLLPLTPQVRAGAGSFPCMEPILDMSVCLRGPVSSRVCFWGQRFQV